MVDVLNSCAEDPTILSGTLRSTLDVFNEYNDAEIVSMLTWAKSILLNALWHL